MKRKKLLLIAAIVIGVSFAPGVVGADPWLGVLEGFDPEMSKILGDPWLGVLE
ncbi:hypothetical protein ACDX78_20285 [Virgibacillus oceani]